MIKNCITIKKSSSIQTTLKLFNFTSFTFLPKLVKFCTHKITLMPLITKLNITDFFFSTDITFWEYRQDNKDLCTSSSICQTDHLPSRSR